MMYNGCESDLRRKARTDVKMLERAAEFAGVAGWLLTATVLAYLFLRIEAVL